MAKLVLTAAMLDEVDQCAKFLQEVAEELRNAIHGDGVECSTIDLVQLRRDFTCAAREAADMAFVLDFEFDRRVAISQTPLKGETNV